MEQYNIQPTTEQIAYWRDKWEEWNGPQGVRASHPEATRWELCPNCNGNNTQWWSGDWLVCYDCLISWSLLDACYDVEEFDKDNRIDQEILDSID